MTTEIVQGDSGNIIEMIIQDSNQVIDLSNSTVQVVITYKSTGKTKQVEITDSANGLCQFVLTSEDTMFEGIHSFQATVTFSDGRKFTSNIQRFAVNKKMGYIPSTGGGGSTEVISGNNGHILVNGVDVKVYDDTTLTTEITTIKNSQVLNRFGISTNGKLTIDGVEQVLDDPASPIDGGTFTTNYNSTIVDGGEF